MKNLDRLDAPLGRSRRRVIRHLGAISLLLAVGVLPVAAQERSLPPPRIQPGEEMTIESYDPRSTLVVPENPVTRARFPFVDVHLHLNATMPRERLDQVVRDMDALNLAVGVNLSGGSGAGLARQIEVFEATYPGRFVVFANVDFSNVSDPEFGAVAAAQLERDVEAGARGLKIFKNLGLWVTDAAGERVAVDDPRLDPIWAKAGELGIPVLIHSADPAPFWEPMDEQNERWLELRLRPRRKQEGPPSFEQVLGEQLNMFRKHPGTTFIAAHLAWMGNDLGRLGRTLDEIPNMNVGLGAVIYEPGRQPKFGHQFFVDYQDRILMGKDSWAPDEYPTYFRVLESGDEYFPYYRKYHAFWRMYGLELPDDVLRKVYYENAVRLIPGIDTSHFR